MSTNQVVDDIIQNAQEQLEYLESLRRDYAWLEEMHLEFELPHKLVSEDVLSEAIKNLEALMESAKSPVADFGRLEMIVPDVAPQQTVVHHCETCACNQSAAPDDDQTGGILYL